MAGPLFLSARDPVSVRLRSRPQGVARRRQLERMGLANSLGKCRQFLKSRPKKSAAQCSPRVIFGEGSPMQLWMLLSAPLATALYFLAFPDQLRTLLDWLGPFIR